MGKILTLGCKVKPRGVPKIWPISETGRANILKDDHIKIKLSINHLDNNRNFNYHTILHVNI